MSVVDSVHTNLESVEVPNTQFALTTDADHTLFVPWTTRLYPDVDEFFDRVNPDITALVSANPDKQLAEARANIIDAQIYVIPHRKKWIKTSLFGEAVEKARSSADIGSVVVLGDRWLMDVFLGKVVARAAGLNVSARLIRRSNEQPPTLVDELILNRVERVGYAGATALKLDGFFRPQPEAV